jgi:hypothetical protein
MRYHVRWTPSAELRLAELWNSASDRMELAKAADEIDTILSRDPVAFGESHGPDTRVGFVAPLGVLFDVDHDGRRVKVWRVWRYRT